MRTNLRDSVKPDMLAPGTRAKIIARNTFKFTAPNGDTVIRLHQTDVVRITPKGKTILNSGGWRTSTTKDRMGYAPGVRLWAKQGSWYVGNGEGPAVPYYDGITLPDCFKPAALAKGAKAEAREQKQRLAVRKFVAKLDKLQCLPEPSPGDCWLCMADRAPIMAGRGGYESMSKGGPAGNADHIHHHVREGYMHGALLLNALSWSGYKNPGLILQMDNAAIARGKKPNFIKCALKRYLYRQLGLVV